jgi:inhibitor of cysteine peptidase
MRAPKVLALGLALALLAPALADEKKDEATVITDKQNGKTVTVKKGATVKVKLRFQAGTGFSWVVAGVDKKVLLAKGKPTTEGIKGEKPRPGGPRLQVFTFAAEAPGETKLELEYKRPFEKGKAPAKKFSVTVKVE